MTRQIIAIIPAAGSGKRMGKDKAKQYLTLQGRTILEQSIHLFLSHPLVSKVVIAVSENNKDAEELRHTMFHPKIHWVKGGETRADSVLNALNSQPLNEKTWVLVHDAARPCLRKQELENLLKVENPNGAILAIPVVDTVKKIKKPNVSDNLCGLSFDDMLNGVVAETVDRRHLWLAQTPQFFPARTLSQAISKAMNEGKQMTDEASAMEYAGFQPKLVRGHKSNIKITYAEDLALASFYLNEQARKEYV